MEALMCSLQDHQKSWGGTSLNFRPRCHCDRLYPCTICTVCHTDIAALQPHCQLAEPLFPMTEKEDSSEGTLSTLIKLNSSPKAFWASANYFDIAVALPLCITPDERLFFYIKMSKKYLITTQDNRLTCLVWPTHLDKRLAFQSLLVCVTVTLRL